jgi:hypothetical protein
MKELTYKDFKIGQKVTCVSYDNNADFYEQHLTIGKTYEVEDVEFHFPNKIAIKSDNGLTYMFFPIKLFSDLKCVRKLKIEKLKSKS